MTEAADVAVDLGALARERSHEMRVVQADESPELDKLAAALAKAQGAMEPALKDSENPHFRSKFADLASVREAARKPLAENGLAVLQRVRTVPEGISLNTMLVHSSGQWVRDVSVWPIAQRTPQAMGSAITYARRYTFAAVIGVVADADDDGNAASGIRPPEKSGTDAVREAVGRVSRPQTASAKQAEPPKEAPKPTPLSPNADPALAMRFSLLWEKAKKAGYKAKEFDEFRVRVLNEKKPSSALTADEVGLLEAAWAAETAREPGADS